MSRVQLALNVSDPAGAPWEIYTVTDDDPPESADGACCGQAVACC